MSASKGILSDIVGSIQHAPDYKSMRTSPVVFDIVRPTAPSDPREAYILTLAQMIRDLRPGQSLSITADDDCREGFTWVLSDVVDGNPE